jgi:acetyl esterase/lipase
MKKLKQTILLISITVIFFACKKNDAEITGNTIPELILTDVAYAQTSTQQKMDVYLPADRSTATTYAVVMIHGGSWSGGDKSDFNTNIPNLRQLLGNYAVFNLNYRLANGSTILLQQQTDDINTALDFITAKASDYKINTSKLAFMGASAGAHLALLKSYKFNSDARIKATVDLFGPTDMAWMYNSHPIPSVTQPIIVNVMGGTPATNTTAYTNGSPINFVSATCPPTIIFHGTIDPVVPISESSKLQAKLLLNGVTNQYVTYTGEQHGWTGANLTDTYNKAVAFIKNYVK